MFAAMFVIKQLKEKLNTKQLFVCSNKTVNVYLI